MNRRAVKSRAPLQRMMEISRALRDRRPFTTAKLAVRLEVCPKVIQRDIDFMRDRLRYGMQFNAQRNTWEGNPPKERIL